MPAAAQAGEELDPTAFAIGLEPVASGLDQPVYVTGPDDGTDRLFVVERPGRIRIIADGVLLSEPFLDISGIVESGGSEQGLLSVAFPRDFVESGVFYVYYTARSGEGAGDNTIAQYRVDADSPNRADPASGQVLLAVSDPFVNHNGGLLFFGPDGYLYAGLGDGRSGGDPNGNGQNPQTLLGSILRLDPTGDGTYRI
ncbi:MAG TPA: PQQ-dependent sugar dehydrogenase, partial [Alphaproteobacteria bacterium]|nr:PQQ-dependent sugar dehydrogenase [Alphaproteobacteria bacterium]